SVYRYCPCFDCWHRSAVYQLAVLRELQQLVICNRLEAGKLEPGAIVSTQPHEALVVDVDAVLPFDPFVTGDRPSPRLDEIPLRIEHDDRRCSHRGLIGLERSRSVPKSHVPSTPATMTNAVRTARRKFLRSMFPPCMRSL